jgi:hypothetical protein
MHKVCTVSCVPTVYLVCKCVVVVLECSHPVAVPPSAESAPQPSLYIEIVASLALFASGESW